MPRDFFRDNDKKIKDLSNFYRAFPEMSTSKIIRWIKNFDIKHRKIALKLLQNIDYYDTSRVYEACKEIFKQLKKLKGNNLSKVYFCSFGSSAKSGSYITSLFATANGLTGPSNAQRFKTLSELNTLFLEENITIVFLDDFIGTGKQAVDCWEGISAPISSETDVYLGIVCGFEKGIMNIQKNTPLRVLCYNRLGEPDRLFSDKNKRFTFSEKKILHKYCLKTGATQDEGFGNCQTLVVLPYKSPNNTVPIISVKRKKWESIFPRFPNN